MVLSLYVGYCWGKEKGREIIKESALSWLVIIGGFFLIFFSYQISPSCLWKSLGAFLVGFGGGREASPY